jgi:hypothetical protein
MTVSPGINLADVNLEFMSGVAQRHAVEVVARTGANPAATSNSWFAPIKVMNGLLEAECPRRSLRFRHNRFPPVA